MNCTTNTEDLQFVRFSDAYRFPRSELKLERAVTLWGRIRIDDLILGWLIPADIKPKSES